MEMHFQPTKNCLQATFVAFPIDTNYVPPNTKDTMILHFYHNLSCICY